MMEDDQQFCLRWNNHQSTLISVFDTLLENEKLVDCTLAAEGRIMKAHKVVLSACSPYFATLLQEQYDKHPIFILKDVKFQELRAMMDYMYRGEVNISQDQLAALLKAAESLQIKGLSDNRSGGGNNNNAAPSRAEQQQQQQQQQQQHHRGLNVPGGSKLSGGYTLEAQSKRARIGAGQLDTQDMSASREGSSSPSRRRRKVRRRSIENAMAEPHDNSNSSQQQQQSALLQSNVNLAAAAAAATALASQLPTSGSNAATQIAVQQQQQGQQMTTTTSVTKKTENVKGTTSHDAMNTENVQVSATASGTSATVSGVVVDTEGIEQQQQQQQQQSHAKTEKQNHKQQKLSAGGSVVGKDGSELVIEPKSEYDEEGNDETCEDLTLDDEDMGMDDLDQNAGTSQGGEGSSQGYAWPHERSQDELLLSTQEAQQRDPQASTSSNTNTNIKFEATMVIGNENNMPAEHLKYEYDGSLMAQMNGNNENGNGNGNGGGINDERFPCLTCGKSYLRKRHLQRHMRDECIGIPPRFSCELCPSRFRRKYHMVRHLTSKHGIPMDIAQQTTGNGSRLLKIEKGSISISGNASNHDCDSPIPENLSMRKDDNNDKAENLCLPINNGFNKNSDAAVSLYALGGAGGGGGGVNGGTALGNGTIMRTSPVPGTAAVGDNNNVCMNAAAAAAAAFNAVGAVGMPATMPTYGLTGAITAISAAAAVIEEQAAAAAAAQHLQQHQQPKPILQSNIDNNVVNDVNTTAAAANNEVSGNFNIKTEPISPNKAVNNMLDDDWKMKLSLQLISNSLLKERLMNTMPFAYNNN